MVANIPTRPISITEMAVTRTGALPTVTAFTSRPEKRARAALPSGSMEGNECGRASRFTWKSMSLVKAMFQLCDLRNHRIYSRDRSEDHA
jgi:hypothetical protein